MNNNELCIIGEDKKKWDEGIAKMNRCLNDEERKQWDLEIAKRNVNVTNK